MTDYGNLYKTSRRIYGKLHYKTLYYWFRKSPIMLPYILVSAFINIVIDILAIAYNTISQKMLLSRLLRGNNKKVSEIIKPIALYLPQYHEIKENNEWWGQGFTEWTNVKKSKPLFEGHYQPHVPHADIGYYDLSDVNVMRKQAKMAKEYGVYGFCFYYYHFKDGKRLLETPINNYIKAKDIDFPFCFAWANEHWTRTWDGGEQNVIMPQDYDEKNMLNMLKDMIEAFKDERYIKHNGKPVLLVYRAEIIPQIKKLSSKWRELIKEAGFDDIYLISMQNFKKKNPLSMGFDAATEFAPQCDPQNFTSFNKESKELLIKQTNLNINSYKDVIEAMNNAKKTPYTLYKAVCPSWDNSPRRGSNNSRILLETSKENFYQFYKNAIKATLVSKAKDAGFVFINAWNEWGEGTHLEPDEKYGYDNLEVIKELQNKKIERYKN